MPALYSMYVKGIIYFQHLVNSGMCDLSDYEIIRALIGVAVISGPLYPLHISVGISAFLVVPF